VYSGAYPTGYGLYQLNTEGVPPQLYDTQIASGFTHFQQSGTGAIRKYNYFRVTPMLEPLDSLPEPGICRTSEPSRATTPRPSFRHRL
jgi:hypothetical protein